MWSERAELEVGRVNRVEDEKAGKFERRDYEVVLGAAVFPGREHAGATETKFKPSPSRAK
ncbi:hypothetical protein KSX_85370 [Ktedonospora formicarum]|uniref:Uncharacterized protein n=1 Tax=Ktedonospora formicarum TaxID=2778364 RepID=A0A8J3IE73_9CHLR|nr:hypothetical protein KSX_85370 [Ktedonospora formicarum]